MDYKLKLQILFDMGAGFYLALILSFLSFNTTYAQTHDDIGYIINSSEYYWGEGAADTPDEAKRAALADMVNKISVSVVQMTRDETQVVQDDSQVSTKSTSNIVTITRSSISALQGVEYVCIKAEAPCQMICYVKRAEVNKIFQQRKDRVFQLIRDADRALAHTKIDDALRQYYWALLVLGSLPNHAAIRMDDDPAKPLLANWLPNQIREVISDMRVEVISREADAAVLRFSYLRKPVWSVEFSYYDGVQTSPSIRAKDGIAQIDLRPGSKMEAVTVNYEYQFRGQARIDSELKLLLEGSVPEIPNTSVRVQLPQASAPVSAPAATTPADVPESNISALSVSDAEDYAKTIEKIVAAVRSGAFSTLKPLFTTDGWSMMQGLLKYGKARIVGVPEFSFYRLPGSRVCCRSIKMAFAFPNNRMKFTEDVTFTFDADGKVDCVAFGLGEAARADIFDKASAWGDESKIILATFLENYKTAYALKRADYIESIFDDDAIIIVGNVLKKNIGAPDGVQIPEEMVKYDRVSKSKYIERLRRVFAANEFVNINFSDNRVTKMTGKRYAIQIQQDYYSSSYSDSGFLFLLVNLEDVEHPIISVRIWQAERDPANFNNFLPKDDPDYGIFSPGDV